MKGNNIIIDTVIGEVDNKLLGHHGGLTKEEMFVPLIVINLSKFKKKGSYATA